MATPPHGSLFCARGAGISGSPDRRWGELPSVLDGPASRAGIEPLTLRPAPPQGNTELGSRIWISISVRHVRQRCLSAPGISLSVEARFPWPTHGPNVDPTVGSTTRSAGSQSSEKCLHMSTFSVLRLTFGLQRTMVDRLAG